VRVGIKSSLRERIAGRMKSSWLVWTVVIRAGPLLFGNFEFRPLFRERERERSRTRRAPFPVNSYYELARISVQFRAIESNSGLRLRG